MGSTEHVPSFAHLEYDTPLYRTAIAQFDQAVPYAEVDPGIAERLRHPERSIIVSCPIKRDDGAAGRLPRRRGAALERARPHEGGRPFRPGGVAGRVCSARGLDAVEVRAAAPAVR